MKLLKPIIISGATASGKSALALELAQKINGVIVNCDSQQVYRELPVITAQPSERDKEQAEHYLYGHVSVTENYNVAKWLVDFRRQTSDVRNLIIVGGTGMYISALLNGLAPIPEVSPEIRSQARNADKQEIIASLGDIFDGNLQRLRRAYEVKLATGKTIGEWHEEQEKTANNFQLVVVDVTRETIYEKINARFLSMVENGAVEEVKNLLAMQLDPSLPAMKACGVPEISSYLNGTGKLGEAITKAQQKSRNYAKRQLTWLRNQFPDAPRINNLDDILKLITN